MWLKYIRGKLGLMNRRRCNASTDHYSTSSVDAFYYCALIFHDAEQNFSLFKQRNNLHTCSSLLTIILDRLKKGYLRKWITITDTEIDIVMELGLHLYTKQ